MARSHDLDVLGSRLDIRIDHVEARPEARIERVAERTDRRFDLVDQRFATMEARMAASIERAIREQTNRFLVYTGALLAVATTVQGIVAQITGG